MTRTVWVLMVDTIALAVYVNHNSAQRALTRERHQAYRLSQACQQRGWTPADDRDIRLVSRPLIGA
jgi:hypothetical protein